MAPTGVMSVYILMGIIQAGNLHKCASKRFTGLDHHRKKKKKTQTNQIVMRKTHTRLVILYLVLGLQSAQHV